MASSLPAKPDRANTALTPKSDFFGRDDILREVERRLHRPGGKAIVLYGQRYIGKTSILLQLQRRLPSPPFVPIYFDLMDKARLSLSQVLYELARLTAIAVGLPPPDKADFEADPAAFDHLFLPQLYQALGDERQMVYLLDEFDVLDVADQQDLPETAAAQAFFPYLRQLMTSQTRLNFIFAVGRRMRDLSTNFLATFKAADAYPVSVLQPEAAQALILRMEQEGFLHYEEAALKHILTLTRGHPYLTQLIYQHLLPYTLDQSPGEDIPTITVEDVEVVVPAVLEAGRNTFQWIWDGLPPAERIVCSAMAGRTQADPVFSEDDLSIALQEAGIQILVKELDLAPQTLVDWQMWERMDTGYRFFVELFRRWVARYRPLDSVKDELNRLNPVADNHYQAALDSFQQNDNEQAMARVRQALELNPNHVKARLLLGAILRADNRLPEAIAEFKAIYQFDKRRGRFELLRTLLKHAEDLEKAGDEASALVIYDQVLALAPGEQTAQTHRTALWTKQGDQALAAADFETAIAAYQQAGAAEKLAEAKAQKRRMEIEQAAQAAKTYESQADWAKAVDTYRQLVELDSPGEWQQALRRAEEELWLTERYAEGVGYIQQKAWQKAHPVLAEVISRRFNYRNAADLLVLAIRRSQGQPDRVSFSRRSVYLALIGGVAFLLLILPGLFIYDQSQMRTQATAAAVEMADYLATQATAAEMDAANRLAAQATADTLEMRSRLAAQATAAEVEAANRVAAQATVAAIEAATRLAAAVSTQQAELYAQATATTGAQATATAGVQATAVVGAQATAVAIQATATHATLVAKFYEPNDSPEEAALISNGIPQTHSLVPSGDVDWIKFVLSTESAVFIKVSPSSLLDNLDVGLYDDDENLIESYTASLEDLQINLTCDGEPLLAGTYYLEVEAGFVNSIIDAYDITVTVEPCSTGATPGFSQ